MARSRTRPVGQLPYRPPHKEAEKYQRYLGWSERPIWAVRQHPIVLAKPVGIWLGSFLFAGLLAGLDLGGLALLLMIGVSLYLGAYIWEWSEQKYLITDRRVMRVEGVIKRKIMTVGHKQVTDTRFEASLLGRILGYGDLVLDTPGQDPGLPLLDNIPSSPKRPTHQYIVSIADGDIPPRFTPLPPPSASAPWRRSKGDGGGTSPGPPPPPPPEAEKNGGNADGGDSSSSSSPPPPEDDKKNGGGGNGGSPGQRYYYP